MGSAKRWSIWAPGGVGSFGIGCCSGSCCCCCSSSSSSGLGEESKSEEVDDQGDVPEVCVRAGVAGTEAMSLPGPEGLFGGVMSDMINLRIA